MKGGRWYLWISSAIFAAALSIAVTNRYQIVPMRDVVCILDSWRSRVVFRAPVDNMREGTFNTWRELSDHGTPQENPFIPKTRENPFIPKSEENPFSPKTRENPFSP